VFCEVSIHQEEQYTSVEELSKKHTIGDGRELLTVSHLSDPLNAKDYEILQYSVDYNNNEGHGLTQNL
jgi:hypothetical protein